MITKHLKTAIVFKGVSYSYTDLLQYTECYRQAFSKENKNPDKIMIFADNCPEYFFATYGGLQANACLVPVDVQSAPKEITYIMSDCAPEIIFVSNNYKTFMAEIAQEIPGYTPQILAIEDICVSQKDTITAEPIPMRQDEAVVAIIYTSGTTGSPKGVMLSWKNFWYNIDGVCNQVPIFNIRTNVMVLLPLHHSFLFAGSLLGPIYAGGTCWITEGMKPESILQTLADGKINLMIGVPRLYETLAKGVMNKIKSSFAARTMYKLASLIQSRAFSKKIFKAVHDKFGGHLEFLVCGGASLPLDIAKIYRTLGFYILEGYGMTETAPMITFTRPGEWRYGCAGRLLPGCEMKITEEGEMCVRGNNVTQGYYNKPIETAEVLRDGWLHTGDTGRLDKYGVWVTGRIKELIITSNGKNINPVEIEHELMKNTNYMKEAAVFMHNDQLHLAVFPDMNEVRKHSDNDILEVIKFEIAGYNKEATNYKRIQQIHILSEELPKTRLQKVQRFKLESLIQKKEEKQAEDLSQLSQVTLMLKKFIDTNLNCNARTTDHLEIDLAMDSLSKLGLLTFVQNSFGYKLTVQDLDEYCTLAKLSSFIESKSSLITTTEICWEEVIKNAKPTGKLPHSGFVHWFSISFIKLTFHLYYLLRGKGKENIPSGPVIYVANHSSGLDPVFVTSRMPWNKAKNLFMYAKDKHFQSGFARFMAPRNNIILMDINSNLQDSILQLVEVLQKGKSVIIFPEGTRSKDKKLKEFKDMFAILSKELNVPIIPIALSGSERAAYRINRMPRPFVKIYVEFLPAIYPTENQSYTELKEEVKKAITGKLR